MITEERRKELVELAHEQRPVWRGSPCYVAGWKIGDYACITSEFPGFWHTTWETIERVMTGQSTLDQENVWHSPRFSPETGVNLFYGAS